MTSSCVCAAGTYQLGAGCQPCSDMHCNDCFISICLSCLAGYFPQGNTCQACINNCKTCLSSSGCHICQDGYSVSTDGTC